MYNTCFYVKSTIDVEDAWEELISFGVTPFFSIEDEEKKEIYGYLPEGLPIANLLAKSCLLESHLLPANSHIDWHSQWELNAQHFHEGYVHLPLKELGSVIDPQWEMIRLQPGPGFGDFSHPTTRLVFHLMSRYVMGKNVVDIGCGSGVLSLAAVGWGASSVWGIDIDEEALRHATLNAQLNGMNDFVRFQQPEAFQSPVFYEAVVLMNMIRTEQSEAWSALQALHAVPGISLVSGMMVAERDLYLKQCKEWNWTLIEEKEEEGWLGMSWKRNVSIP